HPEKAPAYMARAVLGFTEQLERIGEVGIVVLIGGMLSFELLPPAALWFVPLLLIVIRPLAVLTCLVGTHTDGQQRALMSWFGIRGIGSLYYLMYAITHGLPAELAHPMAALTLTTVAVSVVVHGVSVTPLMHLYERTTSRAERESGDEAPDSDRLREPPSSKREDSPSEGRRPTATSCR
ncbi:MAG: cation:proton antiporter, partial [Chloroflexi bacterium]|nr:cation:proton antiporter [Chloroflexota bacterium]